MGHNFKQIDPNWFDTLRVTKLPSFEKQFGEDNSTFAGVRQSRLGVRSSTSTSIGDLKTIFEFELFGTGVDEGQTTFRLRHAWGELGEFGAGQYWSPFTDPDVFPNSLEYWGPTGMVLFRNVQVRWTPISDEHSTSWSRSSGRVPAATRGVYADRIELQNIKARFPLPDFSAAYQATMKVGLRAPRRAAPRDQMGRRARRPVRSVGQRDRLGHQRELEPQGRQERRASSRVRLRRRHPELDERLAGRHRRREQSRECRDTDRRQAAADRGLHGCSSITRGTNATPARSATRGRTSTTPTGRRPTRSRSASTRSAICSIRRCRT